MPDDPRLRALLAAAVPFSLPLRRRFRGIDVREGVLISGPSGWGEFAPFDDYSNAAAARWLDCAIEAAFGQWPQPARDRVEVNAIIPAVGADDAAVLTRAAVSGTGCRVVKVKVGDADLAADEARVATVRDVLDTLLGRGRGAIRVDANGAWSEDAAATALRRLQSYGLEYVEQPCRTAEETARLRRRVDVLIAVDELVRHAEDPGTVRLRDVADLAILKAAPLGGVAACLRLADALDVPVAVSGSLDSSVGLDAGIALAAALDDLPFACGLGTGALLAADVVDAPRLAEGGTLAAGRTAPDLPALLAARDRLTDERAAWWRVRLAAAWQAGSRERMGHLVEA
ncbi:MAG: o-succinylbenzoate synthase [Actinomycetota bacterium]|nr:o-succinylbenzoate synthase [Actinomycetota bacterium]